MHAPSRLERLLSVVTPVRAREGRVALLLLANIFTLLFAYYLIKPVREALILTEASAEVRSYALAAQAALLMLIVPAYTAAFRKVLPHYQLVPWVTAFLALNLLVFVACGKAGLPIGVPYFIWIGIFNVLIVAQFWSFAADLFDVESGERLFVLIAAGASTGAWAGSIAAKFAFAWLDPYQIMLLAVALLIATVPLGARARAAAPVTSRPRRARERIESLRGVAAGFRRVLDDPYLRTIAIFMIFLNCVNSTGEYLQADVVRRHAEAAAAGGGPSATALIGAYYGSYYAWTNALSLALQLLLVGRVFQVVGVGGALVVLPGFAMLGYGAIACVPAFALVRYVKVVENSINYSLQNTARHALILPCDEGAKYAGKTAIDTFFWRMGDLVQAGLVWAGHEWLGASVTQFAAANFALSVAWLWVALKLGGMHRRLTGDAEPVHRQYVSSAKA